MPAAAGQLQAVYLPPFYHSERSLAASLSRLPSSRADRLAAFQSADWEWALGWLKTKTSAELAPEQGDAVKLAHAEGRGADQRPRLREELHRPFRGGTRARQEGEGRARRDFGVTALQAAK